MWSIYILQSLQGSHFYIGVTENIERRLIAHNKGDTRSTKPYRPWQIIYTESFDKKDTAYKREYYLKHPKGYIEKRNIIEKYRNNNSGGVA